MNSLDYWRLCDELSIVHAALLIVGIDPSSEEGSYCERWQEHEQPSGYLAAKRALIGAVQAGRLPATVRYEAQPNHEAIDDPDGNRRTKTVNRLARCNDGRDYLILPVPNWHSSSVSVENLKTWLRSRGFASGFFFPNEEAGMPGYMDPRNPRYAPKLAAAVSAWLAVDEAAPGKSPKQTLERWIREHAAGFGLTDDEGKPVETAMEECAKVANWQPGGGASKTPG